MPAQGRKVIDMTQGQNQDTQPAVNTGVHLPGGTRQRNIASTPLVPAPVTNWSPTEEELAMIGRSQYAEQLTRLNWKALLLGDSVARREIASRYLGSSERVNAGISYERWIMQYAMAHADASVVSCVADLSQWVADLAVGLTFARLETQQFGARGETDLEKSLCKAAERIERITDQVSRCVAGEAWHPWALVKDISFGGELRLADAIAKALFDSGDNSWGKIVYAKSLKSTHLREDVALEIVDSVLENSCNPGALAMKASLHGNRADCAKDPTLDRQIAGQAALLLVAVDPSKYAGSVGRRAMRNLGRLDLSKMCDELEKRANLRTKPVDFGGSPNEYLSVLASRILVGAGRRDLAELQLKKQWKPDDWARATRIEADSVKPATSSTLVVVK